MKVLHYGWDSQCSGDVPNLGIALQRLLDSATSSTAAKHRRHEVECLRRYTLAIEPGVLPKKSGCSIPDIASDQSIEEGLGDHIFLEQVQHRSGPVTVFQPMPSRPVGRSDKAMSLRSSMPRPPTCSGFWTWLHATAHFPPCTDCRTT
jgi:hypothetical protein